MTYENQGKKSCIFLNKYVYKFVNVVKVLYICFNNNNKIFNNKKFKT